MDFDELCDSSKSELELLREKNIQERNAFFAEFEASEEWKEYLKDITDYKGIKEDDIQPKKPKARRKSSGNETFRFTGQLPLERRKSARLANIAPIYDYKDLIDEFSSDSRDFENIEQVVREPRRSRQSSRNVAPVPVLPVEEVTEELLQKIAQSATRKVYSSDGTTCHQCRQKTADTKTVCRSGFCRGARGYFCGPCLKNRYGEDVAVALKDPKWACPICRNNCNCSFCRAREGKVPTGILAPMAFERGYKSVKEFLEHVKEQDRIASKLASEKRNKPNSNHNMKEVNNTLENKLNAELELEVDCFGFDDDYISISVDNLLRYIRAKEVIGLRVESQAVEFCNKYYSKNNNDEVVTEKEMDKIGKLQNSTNNNLFTIDENHTGFENQRISNSFKLLTAYTLTREIIEL